MSDVVFIDTETTGLDPRIHGIWEVGVITGQDEYRWFLPVDLGTADPIALDIGRFYERYDYSVLSWVRLDVVNVLERIRELTWNKHLVGAIPSFDEERLRLLFQAYGIPFKWHYHLIDIEALMVGYLAGREALDGPLSEQPHRNLPWKSRELIKAIGVDWPTEDEHTALGDARLAKAVYERIME